nr:hypothetical protein [Tanacetum cinerariifolium]
MATWGVGGVSGYCSDEMGVYRNSCREEGDLGGKFWLGALFGLLEFEGLAKTVLGVCRTCYMVLGIRLILPNSCVRWLSVCTWCRPIRERRCATWDGGNSTWRGKARVI